MAKNNKKDPSKKGKDFLQVKLEKWTDLPDASKVAWVGSIIGCVNFTGKFHD